MRICLFEEPGQGLAPLSLTRPVFDLLCGLSTLSAKQFAHFPPGKHGAFVRPELAALWAQENPDWMVNDGYWLGSDVAVLVNGAWLPPASPAMLPQGSCVGVVDGGVAWVKLSAEQARIVSRANLPQQLNHWHATLPHIEAGGRLVRRPWDLVEVNGDRIRAEYPQWKGHMYSTTGSELAVVGSRAQVWIHPTARLDPLVVVDTTNGPVVIDREARINAFTRLEGPCYVGPETHILGAKIRGGTSLGPNCRVGGEVEASILHGFVNKYHDGFLGHSYIGAWVNLAAGTHTSDLRCDYGQVTMREGRDDIATEQRKIGCFIGDHTKTGVGTLFNTGSSIGPFCVVLPSGGYAPRMLPAFTAWWKGALTKSENLLDAFATARFAMQRRGQLFTQAHQDLYEHIWEESAHERQQALRSAEKKTLLRSA